MTSQSDDILSTNLFENALTLFLFLSSSCHCVISSKMSHRESSHLEPAARIKLLCSQGECIVVDPNIPLRRYYRSGLEMVRMANVYTEEGSYENAFILYMKFMTLFLEKIVSHPEFSGHSSVDKTNNAKKLKKLQEERIKQKQLEDQRVAKEEEERRRRQHEEEKQRRKEIAEEEQRIRDTQSFHHNHPKSAWGDSPPAYDAVECLAYPTSELNIDDYGQDERVTNISSLPSVPSRDLKPVAPAVPTVDRSSKPTSLLSTKSGGLRGVVVPEELMSKFMALAESNTLRNVETCGVLAGRLAQNQLVVTHLLVPKQCGTSDSCTTQQEEELFDYQDKLDLITIGWIHTHPTQTAFLSSVDLHTHCSYQLMMPEAVAIVCAPKYDETGYFTLTPNHGLSFIASCQENGFHPHPKEPPLFQTAEHVKLEKNSSIKVIDLRN
ncbi:STAM-binding protein-like isoform X2 [Penaeus chinensis]|uniref:STAM-binding protein-like isoform X2 n=1 Tax=Penaeus chinensis TaxID=139456 RepID=UPI001FB5F87F|nr:STAM-binding protein-like isoform X2 [Penaeus chinensis]